MDFGDLETHIGFKWTENDTKVVARQLLEGLKLMHDDGIIHRDLKPAVSIWAPLSVTFLVSIRADRLPKISEHISRPYR
jgi:hypothetical protein